MNAEQSKPLVVSEYHDLLALHRTFLEAKFHEDPSDRDVALSPIIVKMHNEVLDLLIQRSEERDPKRAEGWRSLKNRPIQREAAFSRLTDRFEEWKNWNEELKKEHVATLLAPFTYSEEEFAAFSKEAEERISKLSP